MQVRLHVWPAFWFPSPVMTRNREHIGSTLLHRMIETTHARVVVAWSSAPDRPVRFTFTWIAVIAAAAGVPCHYRCIGSQLGFCMIARLLSGTR